MTNQENLHTYVGMISTKQVGHHPIFKLSMWFEPHGIENILYLTIVTKKHPVAFDTTDNLFTVHLQDRYIFFR